MRFWIFLTAMLFTATAAMGQETRSVGDWRQSIDQWVNDLTALHPAPFEQVGELAFRRSVEDFKEQLPMLNERQRMVGAMRLMGQIGDGHSSITPTGPEWRLWIPIRIVEFSDGYFVTSAHRSVADLAGARVLRIAGRPVEEIAEAARDLFPADNRFDREIRLYALHNQPLMAGMGYTNDDGTIAFTFELPGGRTVTRNLQGQRQTDEHYARESSPLLEWIYPSEVYGLGIGSDEDWIAAYGRTPSSAFAETDLSRPVHLTERTRYFYRNIPESNAFFIQLNQVDDTGIIDFFQDAMQQVDTIQPHHLIIDLRNNFGGDASRARDIVHELVRRQAAPPWRQIYVLSSAKTFSAAILLLDQIRDNVDVTTIGVPPGAPLNFYADVTERLYPEAGFASDISLLRHQASTSDDIRRFLPVDVPAPFSFADYVAGRDPAVDPILRGEDMRSLPEIVRTDGGAAGREAYLRHRSRFADLDWWAPPPEIEFRRACDDLAAEERYDDALEACLLTSEIHPFIWNSWYNLARAQENSGLMEERLASYRCVLALDPTNFNGPILRPILQEEYPNNRIPLPEGCPVR